MAARADFLEFDVNGVTLGALRWAGWAGLTGAPTVVAVHGITSNAWSWDPLAHHLAGAAHLVAVDLRGRGRSYHAPAPYGIEQHADDIAAIIEQIGGSLVLIGHSMGAFVVAMVAERRPELVRDIVLVDGGTPLAAAPDSDSDIDAALDRMLGPGIERIRTVWPDRVSYQSMWAGHPAFAEGISSDLERNLLADLIEVDGGFRTAVEEAAVRVDGHDLLANEQVRTLLDRRRQPTTIIRAEFGMLGRRPPFITDDVRARYPQHRWVDAAGLNHYTVVNSAPGAALAAQLLRNVLIGAATPAGQPTTPAATATDCYGADERSDERATGGEMYDTIVVGTDGSATATMAVRHAASLAATTGAHLHVAMATPSIPMLVAPDMVVATAEWSTASNEATRAALESAGEIAAAAGSEATTHQLAGDPADALLSLCDDLDADLLVVGSRGIHGARRFLLGSVSSRCAHHADRSVLIVHADRSPS